MASSSSATGDSPAGVPEVEQDLKRVKLGGREETPMDVEPEEWQEVITNTEDTYYWNKADNRVQWSMPSRFKRAVHRTTVWDTPVPPPAPPPAATGQVAARVAQLQPPQWQLTYESCDKREDWACFQQESLPAYHTLCKLPDDKKFDLFAKTLARVNVEEGEVIPWVNEDRLKCLLTLDRSIPGPTQVQMGGNASQHSYCFFGDSSLILY